MEAATVRPATEARPDVLLELVHGVRSELRRRGESVGSAWVEEVAKDLKTGDRVGWTLGDHAVAYVSKRPTRWYGHLHVEGEGERLERGETLLAQVISVLAPGVRRLDTGTSGFTEEEEVEFARRFAAAPNTTVIERSRMDRPVPPALPGTSLPDPPGMERVPVRSIPIEAFAELDWRSFLGTPDENLIADTPEENREGLAEVLDGSIGRIVDEASTALVDDSGALIGAIVTAELDPRSAIFLDLLVEPSHRHRGLGRFLMAWGLRALTALGYSTVRLWVTEANRPARRLYDQLGFTVGLRARILRYSAPQPHVAR